MEVSNWLSSTWILNVFRERSKERLQEKYHWGNHNVLHYSTWKIMLIAMIVNTRLVQCWYYGVLLTSYFMHSNSTEIAHLDLQATVAILEGLQYTAHCLAQNRWSCLLNKAGTVATDGECALSFSPAKYFCVSEWISVGKPYYFGISHCCLFFSRRILAKSPEFFHELWPESRQATLTLIIRAECLIFPLVGDIDINSQMSILVETLER